MLRAGTVLMILAALSLGTACSRKNQSHDDPKQQLTDYISKSFAVRSIDDRPSLLEHLSGEAKTRLASWSDDQFREAFIESRRQFIKLLIQEIKSVSPQEVNITYELTYLDQNKGRDAKVTNKKLAQMKVESGRWVIGEVKSIKELVEYRNEMSLP